MTATAAAVFAVIISVMKYETAMIRGDDAGSWSSDGVHF
jgi:hypothetical protein